MFFPGLLKLALRQSQHLQLPEPLHLSCPAWESLWPFRGESLESHQAFSEYASSPEHSYGFLNSSVYAGAFKSPIFPPSPFPVSSFLGFSVYLLLILTVPRFPHIAIASVCAFNSWEKLFQSQEHFMLSKNIGKLLCCPFQEPLRSKSTATVLDSSSWTYLIYRLSTYLTSTSFVIMIYNYFDIKDTEISGKMPVLYMLATQKNSRPFQNVIKNSMQYNGQLPDKRKRW